jgi:vacuolar iron transporter family protein
MRSPHIDAEVGIDPDDFSNPWRAALSSAVAFTFGALVRVIAIPLPPVSVRVPVAFLSVLVALALPGTVSAALTVPANGGRCCAWCAAGQSRLLVTYGIGQIIGITL